MSIPSEISRINNEISAQSDLLEQIQTALDGKLEGGGNELKTVKVDCTGFFYDIFYSSIKDGKIVAYRGYRDTFDVLVNSIITTEMIEFLVPIFGELKYLGTDAERQYILVNGPGYITSAGGGGSN